MHPKILTLLKCPNDGCSPLALHAYQVRRGSALLANLAASELSPDDEVVAGVLVNQATGAAYPIEGGVGMLLSDEDTDIGQHLALLRRHSESAPADIRRAMDQTAARLQERAESRVGAWNREEMSYYDAAVATDEGRQRTLHDYSTKPVWNVFIPRERFIIAPIRQQIEGRVVLEVGCGGARTVSWFMRPEQYKYNYVGVDISWSRLNLAKALMPGGDFFQASALNLPFGDGKFAAVIGFGVFHHLPKPEAGIQEAMRKLQPGGLLGLHEPIDTPKLVPEGTKAREIFEQAFCTYEHSEHDKEIPVQDVLRLLDQAGASIEKIHYSHSVIRILTDRLCSLLPQKNLGRWAYEVSMALDQVVIATLCKLSPRLGPRSLALLVRRP